MDAAAHDSSATDGPPADVADETPLIELPDCPPEQHTRMVEALGIEPLTAQILVRRGITDPDEARDLLNPGEPHDAELLPGAGDAADLIAGHVQKGSRIVVHGDYDVDGVCSTAIMVRALAALGADVTWHVPSRFEDGYGLTRASVGRLVERGAELIIAVDCGIGSLAETELARSLGAEVVICDHHAIGRELPEAAVVHPALGGYPDPQLCASAAAHKLAEVVTRRLEGDGHTLREDVALVGLATVCDVVPLRGENRTLVRRGVEAMRLTERPGLQELMRVAGVDRLAVSSRAFGFGLGPRINAAGRMHSAEPAVELMLTENPARAAELAETLASCNRQRREVEQRVLQEAEAQARQQRDRRALVVAGEGWHPGVLGIVAGRLAEQHHRPAVVLALDGELAAGSARSGGRYDLIAGLDACAELLTRHGGHRAAAGLELLSVDLEQFRARLEAHAQQTLEPEDLRPRLQVDAVAELTDINLDRVAEIERLGPFGASFPMPKVLLVGCELTRAEKLGREGRHFRLTVARAGRHASVVAFRQQRVISVGDAPRPVDLVVELQRNEFRGRQEAQAVLCGIVERTVADAAEWSAQLGDVFQDAQAADAEGRAAAELKVLERDHVVRAFVALRDTAEPEKTPLSALQSVLPDPRLAGLALRVLDEIGVVGVELVGGAVDQIEVHEVERQDINRSGTFRTYSQMAEDQPPCQPRQKAEKVSR